MPSEKEPGNVFETRSSTSGFPLTGSLVLIQNNTNGQDIKYVIP